MSKPGPVFKAATLHVRTLHSEGYHHSEIKFVAMVSVGMVDSRKCLVKSGFVSRLICFKICF